MTIERGLFIGGKEVPASNGATTDDINPFTQEIYARVAAGDISDVSLAIEAAHLAFEEWSNSSPSVRRGIFLRAADLLDEAAPDIAQTMVAETGSTFGWGMFNVAFAASIVREAAAAVTAPLGQVLTTDTPGAISLAMRSPVGVVGAFAPWNAPMILGTRAIAIAMAVGNTVVLRPSEEAPLSSGLLLGDIFDRAGLPPGVLNIVTNAPSNGPQVAEAIIGHDKVRRVSFTGSTKVGRIIGQLAAKHLKPAVLELGGKNALIVLDDADLDYAVDAVTFGAYMNSGQICMSTDRVIVSSEIRDEFVNRLRAKTEGLTYGDPTSPTTIVGPLINLAAAKRVETLVGEAVSQGAKVEVGGGQAQGVVYPPTILSHVNSTMRVAKEEIFGPVCTIESVDDDQEAIALANSTNYGLTAGIVTENLSRGYRVAKALNTGIVHVNDQTVDDEAQAPFGGVGDSGYGKFGGQSGIDSFTNTRWITLQTDKRHFPF